MSGDSVRDVIAQTYRTESRRVLATLIRLLGDFDLAEEMMHEAFTAALTQWENNGVPSNPRAWLVSTARFKAVDIMRRRARFDSATAGIILEADITTDSICDVDDSADETRAVEDDQLRLIFMCCHPALSADAQVALTLREVCALTTEEIAHAFLVGAPTVAQRIVRAKAKIRDAHIPFDIPAADALDERLHNVLHVIYLVFNEGYSASFGDDLQRSDLCGEAIRLARLLDALKPHADTRGLLALMLLHDARRSARASPDGDVILLEDQDRSVWNRAQITEGVALVEDALAAGSRTSHTIQAAIAAIHCEAATSADTDWRQIVALYDVLLSIDASAVIELNRAAALAMCDGPEAALLSIECILTRGDLADYQPAHTVRAELCRRAGRIDDARVAYQTALALASNAPARRFLQKRLAEIS